MSVSEESPGVAMSRVGLSSKEGNGSHVEVTRYLCTDEGWSRVKKRGE